MAIKKVIDNKSGRFVFNVRVVRKSSTHAGIYINKRAWNIETEQEAKKVERSLLQQAERELFHAEQRSCGWPLLVEEWSLAAKNGNIFCKDVTRRTVDEYVEVITLHTTEWNSLTVQEIDKAKAWLVLDRIDREISISRRKRLRSAIDAVFNWGILSGRLKNINSLPTEGYKTSRKAEEKLPEILNLSEIRSLLKYAKQLEHHWYPIWAMALMTGMRNGELYALEWSSVDFENSMILVHRNWTNKSGFGATKARYWRAVPFGPELRTFLQELKLKTGQSDFVLPRFQSWTDGRQAEVLREFCMGSGIPSVRFHTLRACFATQLIKDGVAPAVVMKIAGWKDLKTMQRYIRLAGIEVKGATDGLKLLPEVEVMGRVVNLFGSEN